MSFAHKTVNAFSESLCSNRKHERCDIRYFSKQIQMVTWHDGTKVDARLADSDDGAMSALDRALRMLAPRCDSAAIRQDPDSLAAYACDEGDAPPQTPGAVVMVHNTAQVAAVLEAASAHGVPVTPRGGGTGRVGGAVSSPGGILLAFEGWDRLDIDVANSRAIAAPGVVTGTLHQQAARAGLLYGPDPNSWARSQIGGNIATNAGGPRAFKYGVTGHSVLGLEVVTASGEVLRVGKGTTKGVTGYDLCSLVVGSEGTLAIVTDATLRLGALPEAVGTLLVFLRDEASMGSIVTRLLAASVQPRCVEFLDSLALTILRQESTLSLPVDAKCMLIVELDGEEAFLTKRLDDAASVMLDSGALDVRSAQDEAEREALWAPRRNMSRLMRKQAKAKLSGDVVVPRAQIGALLSRCRILAEKHRIRIATYGHAGDGNLHVNFLWDDEEEKRRVDQAITGLFEATIALGGTLSGEHGIGLTKAPYLHLEQSPSLIALQKRIKDTFDPQGILNPGKIFSDPRFHGSC